MHFGKLDGHGKLQFVVFDVIDNRSLSVNFTDDQLPQALNSFRSVSKLLGAFNTERWDAG